MSRASVASISFWCTWEGERYPFTDEPTPPCPAPYLLLTTALLLWNGLLSAPPPPHTHALLATGSRALQLRPLSSVHSGPWLLSLLAGCWPIFPRPPACSVSSSAPSALTLTVPRGEETDFKPHGCRSPRYTVRSQCHRGPPRQQRARAGLGSVSLSSP